MAGGRYSHPVLNKRGDIHDPRLVREWGDGRYVYRDYRINKQGVEKRTWIPLKPQPESDPEAIAAFNKIMGLEKAERVQSTRRRVNELLDDALAAGKRGGKPYDESTKRGWKRIFKTFILPHLLVRGRPMWTDEVTIAEIKTIYAEAKKKRQANGEPYSDEMKRKVYVVLSRMWSQAIEDRLVTFNPVAAVERTRPEKPQPKPELFDSVMEGEDFETLAKAIEDQPEVVKGRKASAYIQDHKVATSVRLGQWFPLRLGEMLGLRWDKLDFDNDVALIDTQASRYRKVDGLAKDLKGDANKSESSVRLIPIPPQARKILLAYRQWLLSIGQYQSDGYLFPTAKATPLGEDKVAGRIRAARAKAGLSEKVTFQGFRRTAATNLYEAGADEKDAANLLGHSVATQKRHYLFLKEREQRNARILQAFEKAYGTG